jgi:hypothetical protein
VWSSVTAAEDLIGRTRRLGIDLWVSDGTLNFRAPRDALSAELRTELLAHKTAIIESLSGPRYERVPAVVAVDVPEWLMPNWNQVRAGDISPSYTNITNTLRHFRCPVNLPAVENALHGLVRRHHALRCRLSEEESGLRLVFDCAPQLTTIDVSGYDWSDFYEPFIEAARDIVWRPFGLGECLFRPFVIKLPSSELAIGYVAHHFIVDAWSFQQIPRCWTMEYLRQVGQPAEITDARDHLQYSDFLLGLAEWSKTSNFKRRLDYWRETLRGVVACRLPPDRMLDDDARSFHQSLPVDIDAAHVKRLNALAASLEVTLSDVLLAGIAMALQRELKVPDICLRHIWHGRDESRLFEMIGHTLNPVMLRIRVSPESRLGDVAQQVHRVALEAIAQQVPCYYVDQMLNEAGPASFVQTNFQLREGAGAPTRKDAGFGSSSNPVSVWSPDRAYATPRHLQAHDINLFVAGESVRGRISYLERVYDDKTIERFIQGFHLALQH